MKKIITIFTFIIAWFISSLAFAQTDISIIPGWSSNAWQAVKEVSSGGKVWQIYRDKVKNGDLSLWEQFASGILSWDSILDYCVYLVKFIWQVALLIGTLAIIYLWYKRIVRNVKPEKSGPLWMIILWLLVIIFAYVIVKMIRSAFIS